MPQEGGWNVLSMFYCIKINTLERSLIVLYASIYYLDYQNDINKIYSFIFALIDILFTWEYSFYSRHHEKVGESHSSKSFYDIFNKHII